MLLKIIIVAFRPKNLFLRINYDVHVGRLMALFSYTGNVPDRSRRNNKSDVHDRLLLL